MVARVLWMIAAIVWLTVTPHARADQTPAQDVSCEAGAERRLAVDGRVWGCQLAAAASLLVDPAGGNDKVACAAGTAVEFHRSGYLAFCGAAAAAATFRDRAGRETRCAAGARLAFSEDGYLEYCS